MDKVVVVLGDAISNDQYKILQRYLRFILRRPFWVLNLGFEEEDKETFKKIQEAMPAMVVFVVDPEMNVLVAAQNTRIDADQQFQSVPVVTLYFEQLNRVDCSKRFDHEEKWLRCPPPRQPPTKIPNRYELKEVEILKEYYERHMPRDQTN